MNIIKILIKSIKKNKEYKNLKRLDIIWAKRYNNKKERNDIELGHREGSYIVVGKDKNNLLCLYGTSKIPEDKNKDNFILIPKDDNLFYKDIYYNIKYITILNKKRYIEKRE